MDFEINRSVWDSHYTETRSRQLIPDENVVRFFQHYLRNNPQNKEPWVLEIGSGSGRNLKYLQQYSKNSYGMDFSLNALLGQEKVVCGYTYESPYEENIFDIVIAWGVLHYLEKRHLQKTLEEVKRLLKPGGIFFGTIRSREDTHLKKVLEEGDLVNGHASFYDISEVETLLSDFKDLKIGFIKRKNPGDDRVIAHHIFETRI